MRRGRGKPGRRSPMLGIPSPRADERAALACEDLASALDAGIPPSALGAPPAPREDWPIAALAARGVEMAPAEARMLEAASGSGTLARTLRQRAEARRLRAEVVRRSLAGLRYPALLLLVAFLVSFVMSNVMRSSTPVLVVALAVLALVALAVAGRRSLRNPRGVVHRVPGLRDLLADLGELPYLQTLHGLYAAGVPLRDAHGQAAAASPVARVRERLMAADLVLQGGVPLADALEQASALQPESQGLLATGEQAGELEDALLRAARRRGDVLRRRVEQGVRTLSVGVYVLAAGVAVYLIFSFYSALYGRAWAR